MATNEFIILKALFNFIFKSTFVTNNNKVNP